MSQTIAETVTFELNDGVSADEFVKASTALEPFLTKADGFVSRRLVQGADGKWLDFVEWASMDAAQKAAEALPTLPEAAPFMQAIRADSVSMRHDTVVATFGR
ncbi:MAG: hypothetical protein HRU11_02065 [Parvularculaceae bacterium]|nr:hypothetical protein [Parvularculaceae bacterium]